MSISFIIETKDKVVRLPARSMPLFAFTDALSTIIKSGDPFEIFEGNVDKKCSTDNLAMDPPKNHIFAKTE